MKTNTILNAKRMLSYKSKLNLSLTSILIVITSIHSQAQYNIQDSTKISYLRLNEVAKFVSFKSKGDSLIAKLNQDIERLEIISKEKDTLLFNYEFKLIPNLTSQINVQSSQLDSKDQILAIKEDFFKQEKKRLRGGKLKWGTIGVAIGVIIGLFGV